MANSRSLVLLDFDGTLFFTDKSLGMASKELLGKKLARHAIRSLPRDTKSRIYELGFSKYRDLSAPNTTLIKFLGRWRTKSDLVVLTARLDGSQKDIRYLLKNASVPRMRLICRARSDSKMHDEDWKLKMVRAFAKNGRRVELFEDKIDNIRHIRSGINSDNVDFFLVRRYSVKKL